MTPTDRFKTPLALGDFILYCYDKYPDVRIVTGFTKSQVLGFAPVSMWSGEVEPDNLVYSRCGYSYCMKLTEDTVKLLPGDVAAKLKAKFEKFKDQFTDQILEKVPSIVKSTKRSDIKI